MKKLFLITLISLVGFTATNAASKGKRFVTVTIDNAIVKLQGDEQYVENFKKAYNESEEDAINYLLDSKWSFGRKCMIIDKSIEGSKFTAEGTVKAVAKPWKRWRWMAES